MSNAHKPVQTIYIRYIKAVKLPDSFILSTTTDL